MEANNNKVDVDDNLDNILESALEDFEEDGKNDASNTNKKQAESSEEMGSNSEVDDQVKRLMESLTTGEFDKTLEEIAKSLDSTGFGSSVEELTGGQSPMSEEAMEKFVKEIQGQPEVYRAMEDIMEKFLSKDIMYEPMKELKDRYPSWLAENQGKLSSTDIAKYEEQLVFVKQICELYEKEPQDIQQVATLIQQMQALGHPPMDIIKGLMGPEDTSMPFPMPQPNANTDSNTVPDNCTIS